MVLGAVASAVCWFFVAVVKARFGYDDSLDVFGIHGVGGIIGALGTGLLSGTGTGGIKTDYSAAAQTWIQVQAVLITVAWCGVMSVILLLLVRATTGLRVPPEDERQGLDLTSHGESAYHG
jgi:Amt family ammonium transporter